MPYCQNCGKEVYGNFCPNCGTPSGEINSLHDDYDAPTIVNGYEVHPLYKPGHMVLAGWLGIYGVIGAIASLFMAVGILFTASDATFAQTAGTLVGGIVGCVVCAVLGFLCYLPALRSIRKYSPEGTAGKNFLRFFGKSLLFIFLWGVVIAGCMYIIGIFFKVWRLGMWVTCPKDTDYVAVVDGRNIPVDRYIDDLPYGYGQSKYCYMDADGVFYRPSNP